jgi:hypothetical protein
MLLTLAIVASMAGRVVADAEDAPRPPLRVELVCGNDKGVLPRFTNTSDRSVTILKPLDGSGWGWHRPHYDYEVRDATGTRIDPGGRCGMSGPWADTTWPEDYLLVLPPGRSHTLSWSDFPHVLEPGDYIVTLRYKVDPEFYQKAYPELYGPDGERLSPPHPLPPQSWTGTLTSPPLDLTIPNPKEPTTQPAG